MPGVRSRRAKEVRDEPCRSAGQPGGLGPLRGREAPCAPGERVSSNRRPVNDGGPDDVFDVRCYRDTFIPVVYRAFQLGYRVSGPKVGAEIEQGKLQLSREPTAGYRCLGPASRYDSSTNTVSEHIECWQSVHFPYRTAGDIGLPEEASLDERQQLLMPYVMGSGTYWSHVMIRHATSK